MPAKLNKKIPAITVDAQPITITKGTIPGRPYSKEYTAIFSAAFKTGNHSQGLENKIQWTLIADGIASHKLVGGTWWYAYGKKHIKGVSNAIYEAEVYKGTNAYNEPIFELNFFYNSL